MQLAASLLGAIGSDDCIRRQRVTKDCCFSGATVPFLLLNPLSKGLHAFHSLKYQVAITN